ncbi:hypothetical protein C7S18_02540 [Ahniella affigens]|uniref:Uncharacterized protein n=1 Tax=Ahniella affigens TaxID=2021234 RepID=A0A2P1PMS9_9GAMM|nr:hypothetical protein C7S18_02540 [Ahniella affigens]
MKQVLIERPRSGWRLKHKRTNKPRASDWNGEDLDIERQAPRLRQSKHFDDLLSPLRKYLRAQVGRPWDNVYSEMCATIDRRTVSGRHLFEHVEWEVLIDAVLDEQGKPCYPAHRHWRQGRAVGLFVHPRTRLLCYQAGDSARERKRKRESKHAEFVANHRDLGQGAFLLKRRGIWHWVLGARVDDHLQPNQRKRTQRVDFMIGSSAYMLLKARQLNTKELRQLELSNDPCDAHTD